MASARAERGPRAELEASTHVFPDANGHHLREVRVVDLLEGVREHGHADVVVLGVHEGVPEDAARALLALVLVVVFVCLAVGALHLLVAAGPASERRGWESVLTVLTGHGVHGLGRAGAARLT